MQKPIEKVTEQLQDHELSNNEMAQQNTLEIPVSHFDPQNLETSIRQVDQHNLSSVRGEFDQQNLETPTSQLDKHIYQKPTVQLDQHDQLGDNKIQAPTPTKQTQTKDRLPQTQENKQHADIKLKEQSAEVIYVQLLSRSH